VSASLRATLDARGVDIAIEVGDGETVALLGPNGSGKSTTLGMLAGLVRPDSGRATLDDEVLFDLPRLFTPPHRRQVALLAQEPLLFPHLDARANVAFGPRSRGGSRADALRRADDWLEETSTGAFTSRFPDQLSGGQAQRVAIARALAAEPRLLLLDEPLTALDVSAAAEVRQTLARVLAGRSAVIVSHDALDAFLLADRVYVLHDGRVVEEGATRRVLERPRRAFTAELSGLSLLTGRRTADGLVTDAGLALAATAVEPAAPASRVAAAVRPAAVRIGLSHPGGADRDTPPGVTALAAVVRSLEPRADLFLVNTDSLAALAPPGQVADLALAPGTPVTLRVDAADVALYPA
jgi:molybdate transport system ATP-binding protein